MAQDVDGQSEYIEECIVYDSQEEQDQWPELVSFNPTEEESSNVEQSQARTKVYGKQPKVPSLRLDTNASYLALVSPKATLPCASLYLLDHNHHRLVNHRRQEQPVRVDIRRTSHLTPNLFRPLRTIRVVISFCSSRVTMIHYYNQSPHHPNNCYHPLRLRSMKPLFLVLLDRQENQRHPAVHFELENRNNKCPTLST
jgi:hypothetical protein